MSRANPASAESVAGVPETADEPNVENLPTANASAPISTTATATTSQRRVVPPEGASVTVRTYCLPGASSPPVQGALGSGAFWLRQYSSMNWGIRLSSAESTFSWWFHALSTIGDGSPSYGESTR